MSWCRPRCCRACKRLEGRHGSLWRASLLAPGCAAAPKKAASASHSSASKLAHHKQLSQDKNN
ncbi:hypothetical protein FKZ69_02135 [Pseudomonas azotoformans]|nr:hypothetical protein FKZ69_02135 [Pseudomonas azotoformans]